MGVRLPPPWRAACRRRHGTDLLPLCLRRVACTAASPWALGVSSTLLRRRRTRARSVLNSCRAACG